MKTIFRRIELIVVASIVVFLAACATTGPSDGKPPAGPLLQMIVDDFTAAQATFASHAAAAPAGSELQVKLTAAADCMASDLAKLQPAASTAASTVAGVVSLGAAAYVDVLEAQANAGRLLTDSAACNQLTGQIVRGINAQAIKALPGILLRRL